MSSTDSQMTSLSPQHTDRLLYVSRGGKSGKVVELSSQAGSAPPQKRTLLEAFIAATGYVPKYARWLLNHAAEVQQMHGRSQLRKYGSDVQRALFLAWHAANRICAKRLIPFLPTLKNHYFCHQASRKK